MTPGRASATLLRYAFMLLIALLLAACAEQQQKRAPAAPATHPATAPAPTRPPRKPWKSLGPYTPGGLYAPGVPDGTPEIPPDVANLPEPIPHAEPLSHYGNRSPYVVLGKTYTVLPSASGYLERGVASWYGTKFDGRATSSFEPYDVYQFSAAHRTLPLPSYARVTNLENGRSVIVRVNDRGPFHEGRLIDLSYAAAVKLGVNVHGTAHVEVRGIDPGQPLPPAPIDAAPAATRASHAAATPKPATPAPRIEHQPAHEHVVAATPKPASPAPKNEYQPASEHVAVATPKPATPAPMPTAASKPAVVAPKPVSVEQEPAAIATTPSASAHMPAIAPPKPAVIEPRAMAVVQASSPSVPQPTTNVASATSAPTLPMASANKAADASPTTSAPKVPPALPEIAIRIGQPRPGYLSIEPSTRGSLQLASYTDRGNAERMLQRLQQAGVDKAELVSVQVAGQILWRVHVGPLRADEAETTAEHLDALGFGHPPFFKD